jgi:hypothetical protein
MSGLIECMSGLEIIHPFSDVSLRLIMRVADVMMNKNNAVPFDILNDCSDDPLLGIMNHQILYYKI